MFNATLCYIEKDGAYLMIHRVKKENDLNHDKWIGVGGKFEAGESPFDCVKREVLEETGVTIKNPKYHGIITFVSDKWGTEYMHLFSATEYEGEINYDCNEGNLEWVKKEIIPTLPIWEGDKIFFKLMEKEERFFSLKLCYQGDVLSSHTLEY
jgi:8-oxo-dGTP diphosphatase